MCYVKGFIGGNRYLELYLIHWFPTDYKQKGQKHQALRHLNVKGFHVWSLLPCQHQLESSPEKGETHSLLP